MEQEEKQEFTSPLPVLPRLDRLDRLLLLLEDKHSLSGRHSSSTLVRKMEPEDQCKTLSSALEEVHHRGTLMERVAMLENRVLKLSLEMDEGSPSRSSPSTLPVVEKIGHGTCVLPTTITRADEDVIISLQEKQEPLIIREETKAEASLRKPQGCRSSRQRKTTVSTLRYRKWLGWFRVGC